MYRLATLGGLSLGNSEAADVAIPRRRLAFLALLAVTGDRGLSRDKLNPEVIRSDVTAFEQALARGADHEAAEIYPGVFLDGFFLSRAAEFERWVDEHRVRLRRAYAGAVQRIAEDAARRKDWSGAVAAWRRLVALDRLSSSGTLGLVRAMVAAGDHAEALRMQRTGLLNVSDPRFDSWDSRNARGRGSSMRPSFG